MEITVKVMMRRMIRAAVLRALSLIPANSASATTVTIHTEDARATLQAMQNPSLSRPDALKIAQMHGNQVGLRELHEFKIPSINQGFTEAPYDCTHDTKPTAESEKAILLDPVKPNGRALLALHKKIEATPQSFQKAIQNRIDMLSPPNADIHLDGYVIAARDGGGYSFGGTEFFLNIASMTTSSLPKSTTTHELYHAMQRAFAENRRIKSGSSSPAAHKCRTAEQLFSNLCEEGYAMYVEDISLAAITLADCGAYAGGYG